MQSRLITIAVREDGTVVARRWYEDEVFAEASLVLHTKPEQLSDLLNEVRKEIDVTYDRLRSGHGRR